MLLSRTISTLILLFSQLSRGEEKKKSESQGLTPSSRVCACGMRRGVWGYASILLVVPNAAPDTNICPPPFPTHQIRRHLPTQDWQVDFTHMPPIKRVKFLLVFVDTFSGWLKTFLTTNKRAPTVLALFLLKSSPGLECLPPSSLTMGPSSHPKSPKILHEPFKFLGGFTFLIIPGLLIRLREPTES